MKYTRHGYGFTIVELLVVIVVIAILAMITAVLYLGAQTQSRDTKVNDAAHKVAEAIELYAARHNGTFPLGGSGSSTVAGPNGCTNGNSTGWVNKGAYTCTVEETLTADALLPSGFLSDLPPNIYVSGGSTNKDMTIDMCSTPGKALLYYTQENPSASDTTNSTATMAKCSVSTNPHVSDGMRGAILIDY